MGGIKEKILAAKRAGLRQIILCRENEKNVEEIQASYIEGMTFNYVTEMGDVLRNAPAALNSVNFKALVGKPFPGVHASILYHQNRILMNWKLFVPVWVFLAGEN